MPGKLQSMRQLAIFGLSDLREVPYMIPLTDNTFRS